MKQEIEIPFGMNPVDYFNFHGTFKDIFKNCKPEVHMKSETEACFMNPEDLQDDINKPTFIINASGLISVMKSNPFKISSGSIISKFMLLSLIQFKNDYRAAMSFIEFNLMKIDVPYCRVGCDYFKMVKKKNRSGGTDIILKGWKKEEMKIDHSVNVLKVIPKFDDFILVPDNKNYSAIQDNCYNQYHKFPHEPEINTITHLDIPHTINFLKHIFEEQFNLSITYLKTLYDHPQQPLPILVLVSEDNKTGKSTFLNLIKMMFGENAGFVSPHDITDDFNDSYAMKNIILIDETFFEKKNATDKLKYLTTAQYITVSTKFVQKYSLPFFGKIIMCTNKEKDFTQLEQKETRFWVRKIPAIKGRKNTNILNDLFDEIPKFIKYLSLLPPVDLTNDRLVLTEEQTHTSALDSVKEQSKPALQKELDLLIDSFFKNSEVEFFLADAMDIKTEWFKNDVSISRHYIRSVVSDKMKQPRSEKVKRYIPFKNETKDILSPSKVSIPFLFCKNPKNFTTFLQANDL